MDKIRNIGNIFGPDADTELKKFENLIAEALKNPEGAQKKIKKERTRKKKELEKSAREKGLLPFLPKVSYNIVRKDETHVFIVRRSVVVEIDINNPQEPVFVSDKLSDMCGMFFDQLGNRLLVFNTSGHAFLYDMVTENKLLCEIDLKVSDLESGEIAVNGDYLWYLDKEKSAVRRLNLLAGSSKIVLQDSHYKFVHMVQKGNRICTFSIPKSDKPVKITRYQIQNGELTEDLSRLERSFTVDIVSTKFKYDLNGKNIIISSQKGMSSVEFYVFDLENLTLKLLCKIETPEDTGYVTDYHTNLDVGQLLLVLSDHVLLAETENGKVIKNVTIEYGSSALFMDQHMAFIGTWEQMYKFIF